LTDMSTAGYYELAGNEKDPREGWRWISMHGLWGKTSLFLLLGGVWLFASLGRGESVGLTPLNSLGTQRYQGFQGGLYADGKNEPGGAHAEALRSACESVQALDHDGRPSAQGKIVVVGIGASVCRQVFATLEDLAPRTPGINSAVVFVNCARGGQDVNKIADSSGRYWTAAQAEVEKRGLSPAQVQVAWYQSDDLRDQRDDFPGRPQRLKESIAGNLRLLKKHFPNVRICYHSARHTTAFLGAGAAKEKHGEPRPYHVGWAVKWLIEEQTAGREDLRFAGDGAVVCLVSWATYFWTDGDQPRHDGYRWTRDDVVKDGVHLSESGRARVARELLSFFSTDPYAKTWFAVTPSLSNGQPHTLVAAVPEALTSQPAVYRQTKERDLRMALEFPADWHPGDQRAAMIFFYNGGWQGSGAERQFDDQAAYFVRRGMVIARADYREKSKEGVTSKQCIEDIYGAVCWMRTRAATLGIDPERIAAAGGSGSIHLIAAAVLADEMEPLGDNATIDPLPGVLFLFNPDLDVLPEAMTRKVLDSGKRDKVPPPSMIFYGSRDGLAPYVDEFIRAARQAKLPVEAFVGDGGVHGFFKFSPWLEKTTEAMDEKLRAIGYLADAPKVALPHKSAPAGYEERTLATQERWLAQHLARQRDSSRNEVTFEPRREYVYKTIGSRKLRLEVHYPPDWKPSDVRPAILFFGGGGFNPKDKVTGQPNPLGEQRGDHDTAAASGFGQAFITQAEHFAKRGMVAACVEYRKRKTDGVLPDKAVEDAGSAIRWIRANAKTLGMDPARVVACGSSSGGHLAAGLAALEEFNADTDDRTMSRRPDALILHYPLLDFVEGGTRTTPFLDAVEGDRERAQRLSPARHWRKDMPPTLVFIGTRDPTFESTRAFVEKWKGSGQKMDLFIGEGGHGFSLTPVWLDKSLARMEEFLQSLGYLEREPQAKSAAGAGLSTKPTPAPGKFDSPDSPAWIINGNNKMTKLQRLLGTTENVKVVVRDLTGKQVLEVQDLCNRRTNLNELLPRGEYRLDFFDKDGKPIALTADIRETLRLK